MSLKVAASINKRHPGHNTAKRVLVIHYEKLTRGIYRAVLKLLDGFLVFYIAPLVVRNCINPQTGLVFG